MHPGFLFYSQHTHKSLFFDVLVSTAHHQSHADGLGKSGGACLGDFLKWSLSSNTQIFSFFGFFLFLEAIASNQAIANYWVWAQRTNCQTDRQSLLQGKGLYDSSLSHLFHSLLDKLVEKFTRMKKNVQEESAVWFGNNSGCSLKEKKKLIYKKHTHAHVSSEKGGFRKTSSVKANIFGGCKKWNQTVYEILYWFSNK